MWRESVRRLLSMAPLREESAQRAEVLVIPAGAGGIYHQRNPWGGVMRPMASQLQCLQDSSSHAQAQGRQTMGLGNYASRSSITRLPSRHGDEGLGTACRRLTLGEAVQVNQWKLHRTTLVNREPPVQPEERGLESGKFWRVFQLASRTCKTVSNLWSPQESTSGEPRGENRCAKVRAGWHDEVSEVLILARRARSGDTCSTSFGEGLCFEHLDVPQAANEGNHCRASCL